MMMKYTSQVNISVRSKQCIRTLLVQQRERFLASVEGSSGPSVLNFNVNFHPGKPSDTEIAEQERRLAADKGIGRVILAVE